MSRYTKSARGKPCTVRIPGICNFDESTTVFAHINGGGMGRKRSSIHGAYACSACHSWLDGGYINSHLPVIQNERRDRDMYHYEGMLRTQEIMIEDGVLVL